MSQQLYSSSQSWETIEKVHNLLQLNYKYYLIARLAISIWLKSGNLDFPTTDSEGRKFNNYTILNNENYYDVLIRSIVKNILDKGDLSEEEYFSNNSILKWALDYWCMILERIYIDSGWISDIFLKKLYSLKYDQTLFRKLIEKGNISQYSDKQNHTNINIVKEVVKINVSDEDAYIEETVNMVREFMENMNFHISDSSYVLSNSVLRVKIKLPLWKSINSIGSKMDDLKLHLWINEDIIVGPISGYLCFDIPRKNRENVYLKDIINRIDYNSSVKFPLWTSTDNEVISLDLANSNTAHLLIAWATGQWKSECLKSIIWTLINKNSPKDLNLILIDPKKVEFSRFKNIPHLLSWSIVTELEDAILSLENAVLEMNKRYDTLSEYEVNSIDKYNQISLNKIPKIIIIFDEFADFILNWKEQKERLEDAIKKLSWKARAAGIHLILSTQRPDKDIITWVIKANLPAKIAFKTGSPINSSIIIDTPDASKLFGKWDMLLNKEWSLTRIQWAYISDEDLDEIILLTQQRTQQ
jgi:energy-coupling factor transporter ATP-binding protein EcfA2